jgi:hypothetical protein
VDTGVWRMFRGAAGWRAARTGSLFVELGVAETGSPYGSISFRRAAPGVWRGSARYAMPGSDFAPVLLGRAAARRVRCTPADSAR